MEFGPGFLAAVDLLPEPMLVVSTDGAILAVNAALVHHLRSSRQALLHRRLPELVTDPVATVLDYLRRCGRSGELLLGSLSFHLPDGSAARYQAAGGAFRTETPPVRPCAVLLRLVPITESRSAFVALNDKIHQLNAEIGRRQRIEAALRRERETLEVTLASIGDAVIVTDAVGYVTFLNRIAETLVGLRSEQARGRPLGEVFRIANEQTLDPVEDPVEKVFRTGQIAGLAQHTVLVRADGKTVPIDDSAAPIRLGEEIIGAVLIFRDISARRQSEEAARDAERRKDEFLATLAHELRNPLAPIRNALQIMTKPQGDPARAASLRMIVDRQVKHMVRLIDDLMDVSRITQGRLELRPERVDLDAVIQIAVETSRPLLESKRQALRVERPNPPLHVDADLTRLAQVFSNLLNNSAKYSPPSAVVSITVERDGRHVVVRVTDTGAGIPPDMLERVFEMFVQLSPPSVREGLGIGLTLVKRIVELHGGTVEASSAAEGQGSTFSVRLPLAEPAEDVLQPATLGKDRESSVCTRILVADDNQDAAQTLAALLELEGHEIRIARDGLEALRIAEEFRPQIALLDIGMPNMDGYQAARHIRERPWGNSVCLVALTGWGQEQDKRRAGEAGFNSHLVKPADPRALLELITGMVAQ